jgi:hypothetical protein
VIFEISFSLVFSLMFLGRVPLFSIEIAFFLAISSSRFLSIGVRFLDLSLERDLDL